MSDQATELRKLVLRASRERTAANAPPPKLIAMLGGKGGVGVTTLAVNLAVATVQQGLRAVLVDANLFRSDVAVFCGIRETHSIADVLAARRDIHEVLVPGPSGLQIVPGVWAPAKEHEVSGKGEQRLFQQIRGLGLYTDLVMVDAGDITGPLAKRLWKEADEVVLVTTGDSVAVMDSYAMVKMLHTTQPREPARLLVNRTPDEFTARDVAERIDRSCRRFLGTSVRYLGRVPDDPDMGARESRLKPYILSEAVSETARGIHAIATNLVGTTGKDPHRTEQVA